MSMIELKDINKTYFGAQPLHVLKGINLSVEEGEFVSIMGASGSGKSTLLNILGILDNYDSGEYRIDGTLIKDLSETRAAEYRNRLIGFIFQRFPVSHPVLMKLTTVFRYAFAFFYLARFYFQPAFQFRNVIQPLIST